jgi:hypothetical protein
MLGFLEEQPEQTGNRQPRSMLVPNIPSSKTVGHFDYASVNAGLFLL